MPTTYQPGEVRRLRGPDGLPSFEADERPWSRRHVACQPVRGWLVEQVGGFSVDGLTEADVQALAAASGVPLTAEAADYRGRTPFGWVTTAHRTALAAEVDRILAARRPKRCRAGRCALCGCGRSTRWTRLRGWAWADGSRSATCEACTGLLRGVDPFDQTQVRLVALAAMAGMRWSRMLTSTAGRMRLFVEVGTADDRHAEARPWVFSREALDVLRDEAHVSNPGLVVDPIRRRLAEARLGRKYRAAEAAAPVDPLTALW
ncbi:hypothetical protein [uncultured Amnibacterium sp.]|uniref:hypothetical protein n=1 Tax=uncultured Amnibacterium sp. TaxID=1631851 RepID=UPI0035CACD30